MPDPRSDRVFKRIFLNHPPALIHLLNTFLPLPSPIEEVEYMPEELQSDLHGQYMSIVDVRCRDRLGRHFIVEMQLQKRKFLFRRLLYNAARVYSRQLGIGADVGALCPVYTPCLLDDSMFPGKEGWVHQVQPMSDGDGQGMGELYFTIVEMREWRE